MSAAPTIAITGATGFIGAALARHYGARGWTVVALSRKAPEHAAPGVTHRAFDLAAPPTAPGTFAGIDVLVHAAYVKASRGVDAFRINTAAAHVVCDGARAAGVRHTIFISSVSAHDQAVSEYGRQKFAIEALFSGPNDAIVRPGLVLGDGGLFANMRRHLAGGGRVPLFGGGGQPMQTVHIDDLTAALDAIIERRLSGCFEVCEERAVTYREFYRALSESVGQPPRFVPVPFWLMSTVLRTADALGLRLAVNYDNLLGLRTARAVDSAPSLARLGVRVRTYRESLSALAARPPAAS